MIQDCQTKEHLHQIVQASHQEPVFLLKHSTRCPISGAAWRSFQEYARAHPDQALWKVLVVEHRDTSLDVAQETGVVHQSPQILLFHRGQVMWHTSHWSITEEAMDTALSQIAQG
jgi:bacillithiol system protein YtxJ